ncbi:hypothetical protein V2J09_005014 [Rumex salicifolius]
MLQSRRQISRMQMNGVQLNLKEKPVPGCLGRVANLFDLTSVVARNKLLTEKPHFPDGSALSRSRSDVTRMSSAVGDEMEDKMIVSEVTRSSSTKRSEGTPVKMLIAQEMSKDLESVHNSPNLVAKLMGLDALPDSAHGNGRINSSCQLQNCYSDVPVGCWPQEDGSFDNGIDCEFHQCQCQEHFNYKDIYEIRKSSCKTNGLRDTNEKKMALIRQKFMEAKRLSTNEKLRQSKEFQDALEVLSCNPDLFLKVLQEPSSLITTYHLNRGHSLSLPTETKRITVLRPSKMVVNDKFPASSNRNEKQVKKSFLGNQGTWRANESPARPTRIVVLKPSFGRFQDMKADVPSIPSSPRGDAETREAREVAKEITQRMRENLAGFRKDEKIHPSVLLNGYTGDESSLNKSEDEFVGNLSDSEVMSPASRHCWDYVNRYSSPYSCSSLGRVSLSPESSVAREAKKRLSERWAMMSSIGSAGEHRQVQRSASTLGEMLALSDVKSAIYEVDAPNRDQDPRVSTSCLSSSFGGGDAQSPRSLARSKSLPVNSGLRLDAEAVDPEVARKQTTISSLRGKVSSLFFPRSKRQSKEENDKSQSQDQATPNQAESSVPIGLPCYRSSQYNDSKEINSSDVKSVNRSLWAELNDKPAHLGQGLASQQVDWSTLKPAIMSSENQGEPSPISVLEPPFEDDISSSIGFSDPAVRNHHGKQMSFTRGNSNLLDKSPLIGSVARTLTWDEPCTQPANTSDLLNPSLDASMEGEWLSLIQSLLSVAGLENESQLSSNLTRWHSPESPLDPQLREKYVDLATSELLNEPNRRRVRSNRWLVFDFVNSALLEITGMSSTAVLRPCPLGEALADRLWARMKVWLWSGGWEVEDEEEDGGNMVMEMVVRKELESKDWDDQVRLEIDVIGREIEGKLIQELVEESFGGIAQVVTGCNTKLLAKLCIEANPIVHLLSVTAVTLNFTVNSPSRRPETLAAGDDGVDVVGPKPQGGLEGDGGVAGDGFGGVEPVKPD